MQYILPLPTKLMFLTNLLKVLKKAISINPHTVKKKSDRAEILQKHAYGQSTRTVNMVKKCLIENHVITSVEFEKWFGLGDFSSSYLFE